MFTSTPGTASGTRPSFFADTPDSQRKNETKRIENPLLSRRPRFAASPAVGDNALAPLTQNTGLRQRKPPVIAEDKNAFRPPVKSATLSGRATATSLVLPSPIATTTAVATPSTNATPSSTALVKPPGSWVLVYGYSNQSQYDEIVRQFSALGHVMKQHGSCQPGRSNWVAFQYESPLEAEKALCHQHIQVSDGVFCGVKRLENNDPILLQSTAPSFASLMVTTTPAKQESAVQVVRGIPTEHDILLSPGAMRSRRRGNICQQFLRWFLAIDEED